MNSIRQTQLLNKRELASAVPPSASWHADYRDTAYVYIGGFPFDLSEGDLVTIFSQYGNPTHLNLIRDRDTGKSKGFAFLKYEDQRSCDLAVDNLGGAEVLGRLLKVDHTRYRKGEGEDEETFRIDRLERERSAGSESGGPGSGDGKRASGTEESDDGGGGGSGGRRKRRKRAMIPEERELERLMAIKEGDEEDPMRDYLIRQKKEEVEMAIARVDKKKTHRRRHGRNEATDYGEGSKRGNHRHRHRDGDKDHDDYDDDDRRQRHRRRRRNDTRHRSLDRRRGNYSDGEDDRRRQSSTDIDDKGGYHRRKHQSEAVDNQRTSRQHQHRRHRDDSDSRSRSESKRRRRGSGRSDSRSDSRPRKRGQREHLRR